MILTKDEHTHTTTLTLEPTDEAYSRLKQQLKEHPDAQVVWVVTPHQTNPNWCIKWFMTADKCSYHIRNNDNLPFILALVKPV